METIQSLPTMPISAHCLLLSGVIASVLSEYKNVINARLINSDSTNYPETIQIESLAIIRFKFDFSKCGITDYLSGNLVGLIHSFSNSRLKV
ncbi:MAG: hypothetical protein NTW69_09880 [Chloroflexi bacterium]|nr:hypothetical protein [Chloroflexota bacterium]